MSTWMGNFGVEVKTQKNIESNRNKIRKMSLCFKTILYEKKQRTN